MVLRYPACSEIDCDNLLSYIRLMIEFDDAKQKKYISQLRHREEEEAVQRLAQATNIPYINLAGAGIETDALMQIPEADAKKLEMAGFKMVGKDLYIVIRSAEKPGLREKLKELQQKGFNVGIYLGSRFSIEKAWDRYNDIRLTKRSSASLLDISQESLKQISDQVKNNQDIKAILVDALGDEGRNLVSRVIEILIGSAISTKSSDIHLEPQEEDVRIRFRQDGILEDIHPITPALYRKINSRIKILSHLKISQEARAQDGRFTVEYNDKEIEIRVSIVPSAYGEGIVMRILNPDAISVTLDKLGIEPRLFEVLRKEIKKPNGMILTTGPTGSGKTTTLYAFLREIYEPGIKILTIEDPIEYHLEGITQTQTNSEKGYTFLSGLRGALRQDPDVIMVGEIRDAETAEIAVNSSLTGHMVFSTLHTNNAAGAIPRLLDLKVNPKVIPASLSVSIAQRLVRKLCPHCKQQITSSPEDESVLRRVLQQAHDQGKDLSAYNLSVDQPITMCVPKEGGCEQCGGKGYKGRIGVFEAILSDANIEKLVVTNPSEREIWREASKQGIFNMQEDAVMKILAGVTSLEEAKRILDLEAMLLDNQPEAEVVAEPKPEIIPTPPPQTAEPHYPDTPAPEMVAPPSGLAFAEAQPTAQIPTPQTPTPAQPKESSTPETIIANSAETKLPRMSVADLAQIIRDVEVDLLIGRLKRLESQQRKNPSKKVDEHIKRIRNIVIDILKHTPPKKPQVTIDGEGNMIRDEIGILLQELLDIEREQENDHTISAAPGIKSVRRKVEKHLKK